MTPPLDMEAIKRRAEWADEKPGSGDVYGPIARPASDRKPYMFRTATNSDTDALLDRRDLIAEVERLESERLRYLGALGYILSNKDFSPLVRGFVVNVVEETPGGDNIEARGDALMIRIATELKAAEGKKR